MVLKHKVERIVEIAYRESLYLRKMILKNAKYSLKKSLVEKKVLYLHLCWKLYLILWGYCAMFNLIRYKYK